MSYKTVLMPIEVPEGIYCVDGSKMECCEHFDNEGGHSTCSLGIDIARGHDYLKPKECLELKKGDK